jgi:hypothetical protein
MRSLLNRLSFFKSSKEWEPVLHFVVKDTELREVLHTDGYCIVDFADESIIDQLCELYKRLHKLDNREGGMFYGLYSMDMAYRKEVHDAINEMLSERFDYFFTDYKNVINFFITKLPGPKSELNIHQDMTSLDENRFSPLSVWLPLQDINKDNGAVCLIPRTQYFFSPYRSISFTSPYQHLSQEVLPYLRPIYLKKGQALLFDPRVLHHSMPNLSKDPRIAIVSGIFPEEADIITCFKEPRSGSKIELLLQPEEFLLYNKNFYQNCTDRPETGERIGQVSKEMPSMSAREFRNLCEKYKVEPYEGSITFMNNNCEMIGEPVD